MIKYENENFGENDELLTRNLDFREKLKKKIDF